MTPGPIDQKVVAERSEWVRDMLDGLGALPFESLEAFVGDRRNVAAAESFLRRALEALLDLGRHVLAKSFGDAPAEYKEVARRLGDRGVLTPSEALTFVQIAGYRNRLVHFYEAISDRELYSICVERRGEVELILGALHRWVREQSKTTKGTE